MKKLLFVIIICLSFWFVACKKVEPTKPKEETQPTEATVVTPVVPSEKTPTVPVETKTAEPVDEFVTLYFDLNMEGVDVFSVKVKYNEEYEFRTYDRSRYIFLGFRSNIDNELYFNYPGFEENYGEIHYVAVWEEMLDLEEYLNEKFGLLDENSEVILDERYHDIRLIWDIPEISLLNVKDNVLTINKMFQSHHKEEINISLTAVYPNGNIDRKQTKAYVNPICFPSLGDTPIATYFSAGAFSSYRNSSSRYKEEKTAFGERAIKTLDIVYYAFIIINSDTSCRIGNVELINEVIKLRQYGIRVIGSIAGTSLNDSTLFAEFTQDETKLKSFVWNLSNLMESYHLDGLDIDWESTAGQYVVASGMNNLAKALRAELDSRQDEGGSKYLLTTAVPASSWGAGADRYDFPTLNNYLDYINLMSYDANNSSVCSHIDPLYTSSYDSGYGFGCDYGVNLLDAKGFPKNKIMIGVAGYGKAYKVKSVSYSGSYPMLGSSATLCQISGVPDSYATGTLFNSAIDILLNDSKYKVMTEYNTKGQIVGAFLYNTEDLLFVTFESKELIKEKYYYAKQVYGLGLMEWCYCEDTSEWYVDTLYDVLYNI